VGVVNTTARHGFERKKAHNKLTDAGLNQMLQTAEACASDPQKAGAEKLCAALQEKLFAVSPGIEKSLAPKGSQMANLSCGAAGDIL
jgi:hypothetical protein